MIKNKKAIIFGIGTFGELVNFYLENDSCYQVVAFTASDTEVDNFCGKPLISFHDIQDIYPPYQYEMFIAIGYRRMNELRETYCEQARIKGYKLLSYISSKATYWNQANKIGNNVFIFEDNTLQPFVEIGDGTILWSGNHIGHHSKIGKYCFISSHVVISGYCHIGNFSFIGVNVTLFENIKIGFKNLIGAGSLITKNTQSNEVYAGHKANLLNKSSDRFF